MDEVISPRGGQRRTQQRRQRPDEWTKARRSAFLEMLAATCNVTRAAAHAKMSYQGAYRLRARDPQFAELWRQAILMGYERLEEQLLAHAGGGPPVNDIAPGGDGAAVAAVPFDPKLALELLRHHRAAADGRRRGGYGPVVRATREEAEAALLQKLEMLEKRLAREQGDQP
ncbi:hypothetical protein [Sphingomonas sp. TDK1]|uniref:hypothetical protein n=1 Tax=Sphingomonas sp. TDK1 TaxID=453247 RepID=UPI0007D96F07|nr:hypothetical protein [Sphingomonas sp. TDK1]OAN64828.1 hypothetical protein A7X12_17480 [Sphingomonas sp. TDK1]